MAAAVLFVVLLVVDQASKITVSKFVPQLMDINNGFAFGIGGGTGGVYTAGILTMALILITGYFLISGYGVIFPLAIILAGSVSNILDRLFYGGVADFISVKIWPTFNLADAYITAGVVWMFLDLIFIKNADTRLDEGRVN